MPGDYSRFTDDLKKRFSRVLFQQGRVIQDADLDEMVEILTRRDRLHMLDVVGPFAVPRTTTTGFAISANGPGDLNIGQGRAYVDGIVAEALADDNLTYLKQPFYPNPPTLDSVISGGGLVYLDVWDREITALEDPSLPDPALGGVDTSTRTLTVWQVKVIGNADCGSDLNSLIPPSAARLSVKLDVPPDPPDPCLLPESGGLRDVENRFYRVEIHGGGTTAKFKFARDPVATRITNIPTAAGKTTIEVERIGLDSVLRFSPGDWVELTNDLLVLRGEPGVMALIETVDEGPRHISLDRNVAALNNPDFPSRLIRCDQRAGGGVTLDGDGLITATGAFQPLEAGIEVQITLDPSGGTFHNGDTWYFPTRVATQTAGPLNNAPPRSVIHHYCPLSTVSGLSGGGTAPVIGSDCRTLWPPEPGVGDDCECTVCVSADEHNSGKKTIQDAIAQAKAKGGGKVCLKPGFYFVAATIEIQQALSLSLTGHGFAVLLFFGTGPVIHIENSVDVTVEELYILRLASEGTDVEGVGIEIANCLLDTTVQDCIITMIPSPQPNAPGVAPQGIGIGLTGLVQMPNIVRNVITAGTGIGNVPNLKLPYVYLAGGDVRENLMLCGSSGINIKGLGMTMDVKQNWIVAGIMGIGLIGVAYPGGAINIDGNNIYSSGAGIMFTTALTTVVNNSITGLVLPGADAAAKESAALRVNASGIVAGFPSRALAPEHVKILGNRIAFFRGNGIYFTGFVGSAMVKQNSIFVIGGGAVVTSGKAQVDRLSVVNNDIGLIGIAPDAELLPAAGVYIIGAGDFEIADNNIFGVAPSAEFSAHGVFLFGPTRARVFGNSIGGVRPSVVKIGSAGIEIAGAYGMVHVANNNIVWRQTDDPNAPLGGRWIGLRIGTNFDFTNVFTIPIQILETFNLVFSPNLAASPADATSRTANTGSTFGGWMYINFAFGATGATQFFSSEQALLVRGNIIQAIGSMSLPLVEIFTTGTTTFGENDCRALISAPNDLRPRPGLVLSSETAIVEGNHVLGCLTGMQINATDPMWTVLGNIVEHGITVNGAVLTGVWSDANRQ
ncbi:MAG TPA: DUF6519 domain-containing protein [Thermoanaerobaculia bacterium]|jgi:hypothetical protein|nr:DUF6519 domain-containing protein [Thermoanaerobaculia bacterium]